MNADSIPAAHCSPRVVVPTGAAAGTVFLAGMESAAEDRQWLRRRKSGPDRLWSNSAFSPIQGARGGRF